VWKYDAFWGDRSFLCVMDFVALDCQQSVWIGVCSEWCRVSAVEPNQHWLYPAGRPLHLWYILGRLLTSTSDEVYDISSCIVKQWSAVSLSITLWSNNDQTCWMWHSAFCWWHHSYHWAVGCGNDCTPLDMLTAWYE